MPLLDEPRPAARCVAGLAEVRRKAGRHRGLRPRGGRGLAILSGKKTLTVMASVGSSQALSSFREGVCMRRMTLRDRRRRGSGPGCRLPHHHRGAAQPPGPINGGGGNPVVVVPIPSARPPDPRVPVPVSAAAPSPKPDPRPTAAPNQGRRRRRRRRPAARLRPRTGPRWRAQRERLLRRVRRRARPRHQPGDGGEGRLPPAPRLHRERRQQPADHPPRNPQWTYSNRGPRRPAGAADSTRADHPGRGPPGLYAEVDGFRSATFGIDFH